MGFIKKRVVPVEDDLQDAKKIRREVVEREPAVRKMAQFFYDRKTINHFGDDITVSFVPRTERHAS